MGDTLRMRVRNNVHALDTIIGPVFVQGYLNQEARSELDKLAVDNDLWIKLWNAGVLNVYLTVSVPNGEEVG